MKKFLCSVILATTSIGAYAGDTLLKEENSGISNILCKSSNNHEQKADILDKSVLISMDYYREYENRNNKLVKDSLNNVVLVNNDTNDSIPFGFYNNARYLVSIQYKGQEMNSGNRYADQNGNIQTIKYPFENKSIYGNIYTTINQDNNEVNMKLCINKINENQNGLNKNNSIYEKNVKFNEPTIVDLDNGYKLKVIFYKNKI